MNFGRTNVPMEIALGGARVNGDVADRIEVDVVFTDPEGAERRVPAFWAGDHAWRVRYASPKAGLHHYCVESSDESCADINGREDQCELRPYDGANPLFKHGPLRVSENGRYFEHLDGTPFFWLGDTWWMGLCDRLGWPGDFRGLTADRVAKGFTVVQIVAGLYPDMGAFDERGANEAGFPWSRDYGRINPAYFDMADLRIDYLVRSGLTPCIVGCWGYFVLWMGVEKMKRHWRNLVARWGAYPVVWCLAGEGQMPYYLSESRERDTELQRQNWTELGRYLRETDPYHRPVTIHPVTSARTVVTDAAVLNFDMLQTGHADRRSLPNTVKLVSEGYAAAPRMPVVNGEVCYEGIGEACRQEVQRLMFWACVLSGACGHTYGANGIWQVNQCGRPYGPSPHGMSWGDTPWDQAAQLPGSGQLGLAKRLLERYRWWRFEPHPEWVEPPQTAENRLAPFAAGIPREVRVIYAPLGAWPRVVKQVESDVSYRAFLVNPVNGNEVSLDRIDPDSAGDCPMPPRPPIYQDWVIVLATDSAAVD